MIQDPIDREVALSLFREDMNRLGRENGITPPNSDVLHGVFRVLDRPIETLREAAELGRLFNKPISVPACDSISTGRRPKRSDQRPSIGPAINEASAKVLVRMPTSSGVAPKCSA